MMILMMMTIMMMMLMMISTARELIIMKFDGFDSIVSEKIYFLLKFSLSVMKIIEI